MFNRYTRDTKPHFFVLKIYEVQKRFEKNIFEQYLYKNQLLPELFIHCMHKIEEKLIGV
jgi:hypothetical protein